MIRQFFIRWGVAIVFAIPLVLVGVNGWLAGFIGGVFANVLIDRYAGKFGEW